MSRHPKGNAEEKDRSHPLDLSTKDHHPLDLGKSTSLKPFESAQERELAKSRSLKLDQHYPSSREIGGGRSEGLGGRAPKYLHGAEGNFPKDAKDEEIWSLDRRIQTGMWWRSMYFRRR
jgi:hypothetical protein